LGFFDEERITKTLTGTNSEDGYESRIKISIPASFPAIGRFSPVFIPYWMQEKSAKMYEYMSLAAFGTITP
jgi:hypothetical protein